MIGTMLCPNDKLRKSCGCELTLLSARSMGESGKATDEVDADAAAANQISWLSANPKSGSRRHPSRLSIKPLLIESCLVAHHVGR
jgi:hypothetical protein